MLIPTLYSYQIHLLTVDILVWTNRPTLLKNVVIIWGFVELSRTNALSSNMADLCRVSSYFDRGGNIINILKFQAGSRSMIHRRILQRGVAAECSDKIIFQRIVR